MTPLRTNMIMDMQLHRLAPGTQALYLREVASLATYYSRSPEHLTSDEIRAYLHHLLVERKFIRVNQGKGHKDRYALLSTRLLTELRAYWKLLRPPRWLFPGRRLTEPMPSGTARKIYERARQRAQLPRGASLHALRHSFATHLLDAG